MHIKNVNIHLGGGAPSLALLAALSGAFTPGGEAVEPKVEPPAIGQYWEGQGGIYVGMGRGMGDAAQPRRGH